MNKGDWKVAFWMMVIVAVVMLILAASFANDVDDLTSLQADYAVLLAGKEACGDGWYEQLELTATLMATIERSGPARVEFLEGQLDSCNRAYAEEKHNRKYYQTCCPEGDWRNYIDGLREGLNTCKSSHDDVVDWHSDAMRGAPCHSHYEGDLPKMSDY